MIRFVLFITLISTSLLSPLQMRGRWWWWWGGGGGGSGFDDLKCTQLTSYSYPAQLLKQFNCFFSVLPPFFFFFFPLPLDAYLSGREKVARGLTTAPLSHQKKLPDSTKKTNKKKNGHNFHHSPVIGRIHNFASFLLELTSNCFFVCDSVLAVKK